MPQDEKPRWLEKPENVTRIYRGVWIICGLLAAADLFDEHVELMGEPLASFSLRILGAEGMARIRANLFPNASPILAQQCVAEKESVV